MILSDFKWWLPKPLNIYTILLVKLHLPYIHKFPSQFTIVTHVVVDDALLQVVVVAFSSHARIGGGGGSTNHYMPAFFFFWSGDQIEHLNSTLQAKISPHWFTDLRWPWTSVPQQVAFEIISLIGAHTVLGQYSQKTLTLLGQGACVSICVTCHLYFCKVAGGSFMCKRGNRGSETGTELESAQKVNSGVLLFFSA